MLTQPVRFLKLIVGVLKNTMNGVGAYCQAKEDNGCNEGGYFDGVGELTYLDHPLQ